MTTVRETKTALVPAQTVEVADIKPKEYKGQRVVTFADIDAVHQRPEGTAKRNFNANKNRFIEGEDYYIVKPADAQKYEIRTLEIPNRGLTLFTEMGYLMVTKALTDDLAWKVQRELVNTYFRAQQMAPMIPNMMEEIVTLREKVDNLSLELIPCVPNLTIWKNTISTPLVNRISELVEDPKADIYDFLYKKMESKYGFSKPFAMNQFANKYRLETGDGKISAINAVADTPEYQRWFVDVANDIINRIENEDKPNTESSDDVVGTIIQPLVQKRNDRSFGYGSMTYGLVYKEMHSNRKWKSILRKHRCSSKKKVIESDASELNLFRECVETMLSEV